MTRGPRWKDHPLVRVCERVCILHPAPCGPFFSLFREKNRLARAHVPGIISRGFKGAARGEGSG